jgi:hypothetical protein
MVAGLLIAAAGLALLADDALLAASALWGLGLGLLTPSVVALCAAGLYVAAAALAWAAVPGRERPSARRMASSSASG